METQTVAQVLRQAAYPTILAGDLNSRPGSVPVRILRHYLLDAQELGGTGSGDTVPETSPRSRFDYVLYDQHFAVVPGSTLVRSSPSSDHRSVFTQLFLLPSRCGR
jgi:endonuclease/exonuclease/phosphatase family metal-dependent hydrolase